MQPATIDAVMELLDRWLRQEVAPTLASGADCKATIHIGCNGQVRTVVEKFQNHTVQQGERRPPTT